MCVLSAVVVVAVVAVVVVAVVAAAAAAAAAAAVRNKKPWCYGVTKWKQWCNCLVKTQSNGKSKLGLLVVLLD